MGTKNFLVVFTFILCLICCTNEIENICNYEDWPGKNGAVKTNIEIPVKFFSSNDMSLRESSTDTFVRFKIALFENDSIKGGYLHTQIYSTIEKAQLALKEYLETITNTDGHPCLTNEDFKTGDVAFGKELGEFLRMCFTRNNVLTIIHASTGKATEITYKIDSVIRAAPVWQEDMPYPSFILPQ